MNSITPAPANGGIGMEFTRPMGVPPYQPASTPPPADAARPQPSATNIHGGKIDLKA